MLLGSGGREHGPKATPPISAGDWGVAFGARGRQTDATLESGLLHRPYLVQPRM